MKMSEEEIAELKKNLEHREGVLSSMETVRIQLERKVHELQGQLHGCTCGSKDVVAASGEQRGSVGADGKVEDEEERELVGMVVDLIKSDTFLR